MNTNIQASIPSFGSRLEWALHHASEGFQIIPIKDGTKQTYHPWPEWENDQSRAHIRSHWLKNPHDDIGIFTKNLYVLDADHSASQAALNAIKRNHRLEASRTVGTKKGVHDYFWLPPGVSAQQVGHCTQEHPERIDVKTGRSYIIGPGSTDKRIVTWKPGPLAEITPVTQAFVDEISLHNGRGLRLPRGDAEKLATLGDAAIPRLTELLERISPDVGYTDWLKVGMAIFRETNGSDAGKDLFNTWSKQGQKYTTIREIEAKWRSFNVDVENPVTMGTLVHMAGKTGSPRRQQHESDAWFEWVAADVENAKTAKKEGDELTPPVVTHAGNPFETSSLINFHSQLRKEVQEQRPFLRGLALLGQSTVIYAAPNSGKTLFTNYALIDSVVQGDVEASEVYYLNADDSGSGLLEKSMLLAKHGIKMHGDGYNGFSVEKFRPWLESMISDGQVKGKIFILDTLTRFFDTNNKNESRAFTRLIGKLTTKGGTFVGLGHTRKNPGLDGRAVYAGTADVISDFHCVYMLEEIAQAEGFKTVEFRNLKRRGDVKLKAAFSYLNTPTDSYEELLNSVKPADSEVVSTLSKQAEIKRDARVIAVVQSCIRRGIRNKRSLSETAYKEAGIPRAKIEALLPKYAGITPGIHFWNYTVQDRGAHVYALLPEPKGAGPDSQVPRFPAPGPEARPTQDVTDLDDEEIVNYGEVTF